jgi:hypothetical protein
MILTVVNFAKFSQMLLNGGSLDGRELKASRLGRSPDERSDIREGAQFRNRCCRELTK